MSRNFRYLPAALVVALLLAGCGRVAPTSPDAGLTPADGTSGGTLPVGSSDPSRVQLPIIGVGTPRTTAAALQPVKDPSATPVEGLLQFVVDLVKLVLPGLETHLDSGRWQLDVHPGSLDLPKGISISHATDGTVQVEFGPDGTRFGTPVDVTIDYSGTSVDPTSPSYVPGTKPVLLWWDPARGAWTEMPCTVDADKHQIHGKLQHFSRYGCGGKAGW